MNTYPGKTGPLVTGKAVKCGYLGAWSPNPNLVVGTKTLLRVSDVLYLAGRCAFQFMKMKRDDSNSS